MLSLIILGIIILVTLIIIRKRGESYNQEDLELIKNIKDKLHTINPKYCDLNIYPGNESVTMNKKYIYLCLKDVNNQYYSLDILLYVTLHEIAHTMSNSYSTHSHNKEFYENFEYILNEAINKGILFKNIKIPKDYCKLDHKKYIFF